MKTRFTALSIALLTLTFVAISPGSAQNLPTSSIRFAHAVVSPGHIQTIMVTARDLAGSPLSGAKGAALVTYTGRTRHFYLAPTSVSGLTSVSFHAPAVPAGTRATVAVALSNHYLSISVTSQFVIGKAKSSPVANPSPLDVVAQALPAQVNAPQPEWIVIYARNMAGVYRPNIPVEVSILFQQGVVHLAGVTDANGVATLRVDTTSIQSDQVVPVTVAVHDGTMLGTATAQFSLHWSPPTPTLTDTPIPTATSTPTPLATATPLATTTPFPTAAPTATSTPLPTTTPLPTSTPTPLPTSTPTPTATNTPAPTNTPTPTPQCPASGSEEGCMHLMLNLINQERATYAAAQGIQMGPLRLNLVQSYGTGACVGSVGHSTAMANSGAIWHTDPNNPSSAASFPNNLCSGFSAAGENVGRWQEAQSESDALTQIHLAMMQEQHDPATCAQVTSHACNILSNKYSQVGIGIVQQAGYVWLTEDFIG